MDVCVVFLHIPIFDFFQNLESPGIDPMWEEVKVGLIQGGWEVIAYIIENILTIDLPQLREIEMNWALVWSLDPVEC